MVSFKPLSRHTRGTLSTVTWCFIYQFSIFTRGYSIQYNIGGVNSVKSVYWRAEQFTDAGAREVIMEKGLHKYTS